MRGSLKQIFRNRRWLLINAAIVLCLVVLCVSAVQAILIARTYAQANDEYAALQENVSPQASAHSWASGGAESVPGDAARLPRRINPDYVAWLTMPGTKVDYPVVQGADNEHYLNHTFEGVQNPVGCLFMDYQADGNFSGRNTIVYGHSVNNGSMFGQLYKYLDAAFLTEYSTITVVTIDGRVLTYKIFSARQSDIYDSGYQNTFVDNAAFEAFAAGIGAPVGTQQVLTLSTCAETGQGDKRILVHAALE